MTSNRQGSVKLDAIPCFPYPEFLRGMHGYLRNEPCHLAAYFGMPSEEGLRLFCLVLADASGKILIASSPARSERYVTAAVADRTISGCTPVRTRVDRAIRNLFRRPSVEQTVAFCIRPCRP